MIIQSQEFAITRHQLRNACVKVHIKPTDNDLDAFYRKYSNVHGKVGYLLACDCQLLSSERPFPARKWISQVVRNLEMQIPIEDLLLKMCGDQFQGGQRREIGWGVEPIHITRQPWFVPSILSGSAVSWYGWSRSNSLVTLVQSRKHDLHSLALHAEVVFWAFDWVWWCAHPCALPGQKWVLTACMPYYDGSCEAHNWSGWHTCIYRGRNILWLRDENAAGRGKIGVRLGG